MALRPLFISTATLKAYGVIENNVDDKLLSQTIMMVQDVQLQQIYHVELQVLLEQQLVQYQL